MFAGDECLSWMEERFGKGFETDQRELGGGFFLKVDVGVDEGGLDVSSAGTVACLSILLREEQESVLIRSKT